MSNKRFDFSVLPDGFLVEIVNTRSYPSSGQTWSEDGGSTLKIARLDNLIRSFGDRYVEGIYRPALNHWHFNDGSMVLPDGLVVEFVYVCGSVVVDELFGHIDKGMICHKHRIGESLKHKVDIGRNLIAVRIIGAYPDYAEHAKELGMQVIEI